MIFSRDNITLCLSVFGSLGTLWAVIQNRKKISIVIDKEMRNEQSIAFDVQIVNESRMSIAITDISLIMSKTHLISCNKDRLVAHEKSIVRAGKILDSDIVYTAPFPLQLVGLGGLSTSLRFDIPKDACTEASTPLSLRVSTNRGQIKVSPILPGQEYNPQKPNNRRVRSRR